MTWPLYPQGKPWYPLLYRRMCQPQCWSGHCCEEKHPVLLRIKPQSSSPSIAKPLTKVSWLCHNINVVCIKLDETNLNCQQIQLLQQSMKVLKQLYDNTDHVFEHFLCAPTLMLQHGVKLFTAFTCLLDPLITCH
jgi:hypothetical protein